MTLLATLIAVSLVTEQAAAPKPTPTPAPPPAIEGTVRGPAGVPVKDAVVVARPRADDAWARGEPPMTTRTDRDGRFRIVLKKPAPVDLQVQADGLAPKALPRVFPGRRLEISLDKGRFLQGVVRDATSGKPIAGARVESFSRRRWESTLDQPEGLRQAVTDANGLFKLEGLGAGPVTVTASRPRYGRTQRAGVLAGARLELLLQPGSSILGVVRGPDGKGVSGAQVQAESREWLPPLPETTDAEGRFELAGVRPDTYRVWAHRRGLGTSLIEEATLEREVDTAVTLHIDPGADVEGRLVAPQGKPLAGQVWVLELDGSRSQLIGKLLQCESAGDGRFRLANLPAGSHALAVRAAGFAPRRVDLTIPQGRPETVDLGDVELERGLTIQGRVVDKTGSAVAEARIRGWSNTPEGGGSIPEANSEADGTFVLAGLEPGRYWMSVTAPGYGGQGREVDTGAEKLLFRLEPAGTIAGQVVDERGAAVEAFRVWARVQREGQGVVSSQGPRTVEASDGRFTLEDLAEGTYRVEAAAEGKRPGSVKDVAVRPGSTVDVGRIRLEAGGTIRGVVVDTRGAPVASASVSAVGGERRRAAEGQASSGLDGAFEIQGLPFGTLEVRASHPDFAAGKSDPVIVEPGQGPAITRIVLTAGGRIEGHARRRDGTGIAGARVQVYMPGEHWLGHDVPVSAADGSFVAEHVPAGRIGVHVRMDGVGSWVGNTELVTVVEGEVTTVDFLFRDVLVSGRVTRFGDALAGARVRIGYDGGGGSSSEPLGPPPPAGPRRGVAVTGADGGYELIADQPGETRLAVESLDYRTSYLNRNVTLPDADTFVLDLALSGAPVSGIVVDRETGDPIAHASVAAYLRKPGPDGMASAETGPDGRFSMDVEPGDYSLTATASGYAQDSVELKVGSAGAADVRLALPPGRRIEGKVVDAAGRGVGGLHIGGLAGDPNDVASPRGFAETASDGSFTMEGLLDRAYNLFTGTALAGFAMAPQVPAGQTDVVLALSPAGRLRVSVEGPGAVPVDRAWVGVTRVAGHSFWTSIGSIQASTGPDGSVELLVPRGPIEVTVGKGNSKASAGVDVPVDGVAALELTLPVS